MTRVLKQGLLSTINGLLVDLAAPINLSYWWNLGSLLGVTLVFQILSGVFLSMHYIPDLISTFDSVEHIIREVSYGWLLRYIHMNGASLIFILLYLHIGRGIYYSSYTWPRIYVWSIGVLMLFMMMAISFLGYVLPWGQMSFWGATVITNMIGAIPVIGDKLLIWIWGGFTVSSATLGRFYSLHYLLPLVLLVLVIIHIELLHLTGSNNPLGISGDKIRFHPLYSVKDILGFIGYFVILFVIVTYGPMFFNHPDNSIEADPLVTPSHIEPEWYFLPYYTILRAVPSKLLGVILMVLSIGILFTLPLTHLTPVRRSLLSTLMFWFLTALLVILMEEGHSTEGIITTLSVILYFSYFLVFRVLVGIVEGISYLRV